MTDPYNRARTLPLGPGRGSFFINAQQFEAVSTTAATLGKTLLPLRIDSVDIIRDALERARSAF